MTVAEATPALDLDDRAFLGHPKGLGYLAFTEAWERFSYYGMQALLVLYLVNYLLLPENVDNVAFFDSFRTLYGGLDGQPLASAIVGTYFALVYLTPILGGLLADRALYRPEDLRRADAFQIFYLGINAGVIAAPLVVGSLGEKIGWHWGFGAAGVGMLIALAIYVAGQKSLPPEHFQPQGKAARAAAPKLTRVDWLATIALILLIPVMAAAIVPNNQ